MLAVSPVLSHFMVDSFTAGKERLRIYHRGMLDVSAAGMCKGVDKPTLAGVTHLVR